MGKRKQTEAQVLITIGMTATEEALNTAIESLVAIKANRFPRAAPKVARRTRSDAGLKRGTKANGSDNDSDKLEGS